MKKVFKKVLSVMIVLTLVLSVNMYQGTHTHVHAEDVQVQDENGRITDAELNMVYTLETSEEMPYVVVEFTPSKGGTYIFNTDVVEGFESFDGYGYLYDDNDIVESEIANGKANIEAGNTQSDYVRLNDYLYCDDSNSESGDLPKIEAELMGGTTYYFVLGGYDGEQFGKTLFNVICPHANTELRDNTLTDCTEGGYTGDTYCAICDELLEEGKTVESADHTPETVNKVDASCYMAGYTGDTVCHDCGSNIETGSVIDVFTHEYENDVCKHCGRITNAQLNTQYDSYISENVPYQVIEFTPSKAGTYSFFGFNEGNYWDGYGYLYDDKTLLEASIKSGIDDILSGDDGHVRLSGYLTYDDDNGNNGIPAITYDLNAETTYYFVVGSYNYNSYSSGTFSLTISCEHSQTEVRNRDLDSCELGGYTGDTYCLTCDELVEEGQWIEAGGHAEQILDESTVIEVTCTSNGYSGDYICPECGEVLEEGYVIETEGHLPSEDVSGAYDASCYCEGYTGDIVCQNCPEVLTEGTAIPQLTHEYEDDQCINCGRIINAVIDVWYYTETTMHQMYQVIEFTVPADGKYNIDIYFSAYGTIYIYEKSETLDDKISKAIVKCNANEDIPYLAGAFLKKYIGFGNYFGDISLKKDTTYCLVVGPDGYLEDYGIIEVCIGCEHEHTNVKGKTIVSCETGGYTGDIICDDCGDIVTEGVDVEPNSEHSYSAEVTKEATCKTYAEIKYTCACCDHSYVETDIESGYSPCRTRVEGYVAPTCTTVGYSGDNICKDCGYVVSIGSEIPAYHDCTDSYGENPYFYYGYQSVNASCTVDGYEGDTICSICKEIIAKGETNPALGHNYVGGVCTICDLDEDFLEKDENSFYLISTVEDLMEFVIYADRGIKGKLMADITFPDDYQNEDWDYDCAYNTVLDGNNHTIENINLNGQEYSLFDTLENSTIKNLTVTCDVEEYQNNYFGAIARYAYASTFENCTVNGTIVSIGEDGYCGGFVGEAYECVFKDSTNNADIFAEGGNVGGFIGYGEWNIFINCINNGNIHGDEDEIAGIAGQSDYSVFDKCVNNGDITTKDEQAAGIVGVIHGSDITDCKNAGSVKYIGTGESQDEIGGIVASAYDGSTVGGCENNGFIGNEDKEVYIDEVGGIVGQMFDYGTITNCVNNGNVTAGGMYVGGIVGDIDWSYYDYEYIDIEVRDCVNNGDIYGDSYVGGIAGYSEYAIISNCTNNGGITGVRYVAGIGGYAGNATIDNVYNTGTITGYNEDNISNLVHGTEDGAIITNSDGNHTHSYEVATVITPATLVANGKAITKCACGKILETAIISIADAMLSKVTYAYTGKAISLPTVIVVDKTSKAIGAENYTVSYVDSAGKVVTSIVEAGTYTVKITFKGSYAGEITKTITVNKTVENITNPAKVKITSAKNIKAKKVKLTWKKIADATGYEVRYATNKKFKKAKVKSINKNKVKVTLKKLNKKKYFIQVRAVKIVEGTKYVGEWSAKKKVKMTK